MKMRTKDDGTKQICLNGIMWVNANETLIVKDDEKPVFKD